MLFDWNRNCSVLIWLMLIKFQSDSQSSVCWISTKPFKGWGSVTDRLLMVRESREGYKLPCFVVKDNTIFVFLFTEPTCLTGEGGTNAEPARGQCTMLRRSSVMEGASTSAVSSAVSVVLVTVMRMKCYRCHLYPSTHQYALWYNLQKIFVYWNQICCIVRNYSACL